MTRLLQIHHAYTNPKFLEGMVTGKRETFTVEGFKKWLKEMGQFQQLFIDDPKRLFYFGEPSDAKPYERPGILPFGAPRWSPYDVYNHRFGKAWLGNMTGLICKRMDQDRVRASRIIWCHGVPPRKNDRIGTEFVAYHDQTGKKLGVYEVVGLICYDPDGNVGVTAGEVPDIKLAENTYK